MIKIKNAQLATSAVRPDQYPDPLPCIALFGRSNAGKSSLINVLIQRRNLARTSSAPGKTRLLNFYRIDAAAGEDPFSFYFVDLPGYGYAKVSKAERGSWLGMMERFLAAPGSKLCWQLVDIRHAPSREDVLMHEALIDAGFPPLTVANKIDKVGKNQRAASLKVIAETLSIERQSIIPFSAVTREGREALLEQIAPLYQK